MDKATSLHSSVPTPPPRLYLPRNFSCSACLYGSLAEPCKADCSPEPDGEPPPAPVLREAAAAGGEEKPPPPSRGREPSVPPVPPSPTLRRRAKSLPTPGERGLRPAPQQSPSRRKTVRFADSLGLELISVRHFCQADLPRVPAPLPARAAAAAAAELLKTRKPPALGELEPVPFGPPPLEPLFPPQPGAGPGFAERVRRHKVRLEWVRAEPAGGLRGAARVLNLAYEKAVSVRYTLDRWASCAELPAAYLPPGPPDGLTDRFGFQLPPAAAGGTLEFALRYRVAGAEYWDNNGGLNYRLRARPPAAAAQPDGGGAWIHFI